MTNVNFDTIGGPGSGMVAYFPPWIIHAGTAEEPSCSSWVGSGSAVTTDSAYTDNGSSRWLVAPSSQDVQFTQGRKADYWTLPPTGDYTDHRYSLASCQPFIGWEFLNVPDSPAPVYSPFDIDFMAVYDNEFDGGEKGPSQNSVRSSRSWITVNSQPGPPDARDLSIKCYPGNQLQFGPDAAGVPLSQFSSIRSRVWTLNPHQPADEYTRDVYESAYDCYQHYPGGGTVEVMFWTYNHGQNQTSIGPVVETVDLGDGRGYAWELIVSTNTLADGGIGDGHPYGIFYLSEELQGDDVGYIDILAGLRYFNSRYTLLADESSALELPLWQITKGYELATTNRKPIVLNTLDYRLEVT